MTHIQLEKPIRNSITALKILNQEAMLNLLREWEKNLGLSSNTDSPKENRKSYINENKVTENPHPKLSEKQDPYPAVSESLISPLSKTSEKLKSKQISRAPAETSNMRS